MVTNFFESGFKDFIKAIFKIVSILPAEFTEEYQARHVIKEYARNKCFKDPYLSAKVFWVTQVSCCTPHHNVVVFNPSTNEMKLYEASQFNNYCGGSDYQQNSGE